MVGSDDREGAGTLEPSPGGSAPELVGKSLSAQSQAKRSTHGKRAAKFCSVRWKPQTRSRPAPRMREHLGSQRFSSRSLTPGVLWSISGRTDHSPASQTLVPGSSQGDTAPANAEFLSPRPLPGASSSSGTRSPPPLLHQAAWTSPSPSLGCTWEEWVSRPCL